MKNPAHWSERQREALHSLKLDTLKVGHAWAIKEAFAPFWDYRYGAAAKRFFDRWYFWATHSRLAPIIAAAKTFKRHLPGLLAYICYRNFAQYRTALLFYCGKLDLYPADGVL